LIGYHTKSLKGFTPCFLFVALVTTRTTSLASVPHTTFALRFSDLFEIEESCKEDEEQRSARIIDWISGKINQRCAEWVSEMEGPEGRDGWRTPWWDEVRQCVEGDPIPSRHEGWNHPISSECYSVIIKWDIQLYM